MEANSTSVKRNRIRALTGACVVAVAVCGFASQALGSFGAASNFAANSKPIEAAIGDLDGDGILDIVVANNGDNGVTVLLGNGDATFAAPALYGIGNTTYSAAIGDLTGDDIPDIAAANFGSAQVMVLPGTGDGTFGAGTNYPVGDFPISVAIGDLNGDGNPDLVSANNDAGGTVSILLSDGSGSFEDATTLAVGIPGLRSVALGNLNGDSFLDLVVVSPNETPSKGSVNYGKGDGTFEGNLLIEAERSSVDVAIGDFNTDGEPDLAVANVLSDSISILLGDSLDGFGPATNFPAGQNPQSVTIGDLDGDGHLDLVVPNRNNAGVLKGNGDGTFADAAFFAAGTFPSSAVIGNLDDDSNPDLGVANFNSNDVSILRNQAPTATAAPSSLSFGDQDEGSASAAKTVTVTNASGGDPMSVSGVSVSGTGAADFAVAAETCSTDPVTLSGNCEVEVTFTPSGTGARSASLEVTYNGGASPLTVPLSGTGVPVCPEFTTGTPPDCDPVPCPAGFTGNEPDCVQQKARISKVKVTGPAKVKRGKKATYKVAITNSGGSAATGAKLKVSGRGVGSKSSVGTIAAGQTKTVKIKIKPKKTGRIKAAFKVTSSNAGGKSLKKTITVRK